MSAHWSTIERRTARRLRKFRGEGEIAPGVRGRMHSGSEHKNLIAALRMMPPWIGGIAGSDEGRADYRKAKNAAKRLRRARARA